MCTCVQGETMQTYWLEGREGLEEFDLKTAFE